MTGFPIPSKNYFPKPFQDYNDAGFVALTNKIDSILTGIQSDMVNFRNLRRVEKMSRPFLEAMGYMLTANILLADTDVQAARKVYGALKQRKFKASWLSDVKPKIDIVTGASAIVYSPLTEPDWIVMCGLATDPPNWWGVIGTDGTDANQGLDIVADGTESEVAGNVYIDVGISTLTAAQITQIVLSIAPSTPCFFRIYLGYTVGTNFVLYAGGVVG